MTERGSGENNSNINHMVKDESSYSLDQSMLFILVAFIPKQVMKFKLLFSM